MQHDSEKRILKINPDLFSLSNSNNTTRKKHSDQRIKIKTNEPKKRTETLKKRSILNMIRKQQHERYKNLLEDNNSSLTPKPARSSQDEPLNSSFQEATHFLQHMSEKKKEENKRNYTLKQYLSAGSPSSSLPGPSPGPLPSSITGSIPSSIPGPSPGPLPGPLSKLQPQFYPSVQFGSPQPNHLEEIYKKPLPVPLPPSSWGCLKGGKLPTYRHYMNKTRDNQPMIYVNPQSNVSSSLTAMPDEREAKRKESIQRAEMAMQMKHMKSAPPLPSKIMKQKKTRKRTYKVGKSKFAPKIGVLVSNKTIRNHVSTQSQLLKQKSIEEIKHFLVKHGMIKVGSIAPNDVLRKMYESATMICGEVYNHNNDVLLHNFMNGEKNG
jgi:hypothetical protein